MKTDIHENIQPRYDCQMVTKYSAMYLANCLPKNIFQCQVPREMAPSVFLRLPSGSGDR